MEFTARRLATACAALVLALPASAQAASIAVDGGQLKIDGASGYLDLDVLQDGSDFTVYDYSGDVTAGSGCAAAAPDPVAIVTGGGDGDQYTCTGDVAGVTVEGGAQGDYVYLGASVPAVMHGNAGDDYLSASGAAERLDGGDGDDNLRAGDQSDTLVGGDGDDDLQADPSSFDDTGASPSGAPDVLDGGAGRDFLNGGAGADTVTGGDGRDAVVYFGGGPVTVSLAAPAPGGDAITGVEVVMTDTKDDVVTGDARFNELYTSEGNDTADGGAGSDLIDTGDGDDTVLARDGAVDDISCGKGNDKVTADPDDFVDADCEAVERAAAPVTAAPSLPIPALQLAARVKHRRLAITGRVVPPAGSDASACAGGGVTIAIAGLGKRVKHVGTALRADCTFSVKVKAGKRARRARVSASFAGTPRLGAASSAPMKARRWPSA
jgi:Ca2+-binding RTX toxin-like protein